MHKTLRNRGALAGLGVVAMLTVTSCAQPAAAAASTVAPAAQVSLPSQNALTFPPPAPGTDPQIQRWLLGIDTAKVAFNNVLLRAERAIAAGSGTADCSALLNSIAVINRALPALAAVPNGGKELAAAYGPPLQQFGAVATACVQSHFDTARTLLGNLTTGAIAAYGAAQAKVDEILDGGA